VPLIPRWSPQFHHQDRRNRLYQFKDRENGGANTPTTNATTNLTNIRPRNRISSLSWDALQSQMTFLLVYSQSCELQKWKYKSRWCPETVVDVISVI
jgi:hypothetical protein